MGWILSVLVEGPGFPLYLVQPTAQATSFLLSLVAPEITVTHYALQTLFLLTEQSEEHIEVLLAQGVIEQACNLILSSSPEIAEAAL